MRSNSKNSSYFVYVTLLVLGTLLSSCSSSEDIIGSANIQTRTFIIRENTTSSATTISEVNFPSFSDVKKSPSFELGTGTTSEMKFIANTIWAWKNGGANVAILSDSSLQVIQNFDFSTIDASSKISDISLVNSTTVVVCDAGSKSLHIIDLTQFLETSQPKIYKTIRVNFVPQKCAIINNNIFITSSSESKAYQMTVNSLEIGTTLALNGESVGIVPATINNGSAVIIKQGTSGSIQFASTNGVITPIPLSYQAEPLSASLSRRNTLAVTTSKGVSVYDISANIMRRGYQASINKIQFSNVRDEFIALDTNSKNFYTLSISNGQLTSKTSSPTRIDAFLVR